MPSTYGIPMLKKQLTQTANMASYLPQTAKQLKS